MFTSSLKQRSSNHTYSLFIRRVFTQGSLNSFWTACLYTRQTELLLNHHYHILSCLLYRRARSLLNTLEAECFCLHEISINVNKLLAVLLLLLYVYICFLLLNLPFFILMLLLYFSLFIDHVNKFIIFVFGAFIILRIPFSFS